MLKPAAAFILLILAALLVYANQSAADFRFAILGDRTGGAQSGVFEQALTDALASHPDFVITVGDAIEGGDDTRTDAEWHAVITSIEQRAMHVPVFFTPGNHDVWSESSARAYERYTRRPLHYSFDYGQAHFTVLDNSETEQFSAAELAYLEKDLSEHSNQPLKFVLSHRPSWILQALLRDRGSIYQQLAKKYQVQYFIAGHIHQMLYFQVDDVHYLCMPSAGGHLRGDKRYESGWFFAETQVQVHGPQASFTIHELSRPFGDGRISKPAEWGAAGLLSAGRPASAGRP